MIVLDVEMPRMDGLTFLRKLMRQHPMPVVLCTTQAERAVTALEMGAIEVIAKPDWNNASRLAEWSQNLLESIRNAARAGRLPFRDDRPATSTDPRHTADVILPKVPYSPRAGVERTDHRRRREHRRRAGPAAVAGRLPGRAAPGIVIVQHMPPDFTRRSPTGWTTTRGSRWRSPRRGSTSRSGAGRALVIPGRHPRPDPPVGHRLSGRAGRRPAGLPAPAQRRGPVPLGGAGGRALRRRA